MSGSTPLLEVSAVTKRYGNTVALDGVSLRLDRGEVIGLDSYRDAVREGVFHIYQELALIPSLTVYENVLLAHEDAFSRMGVISNRRMREHVSALLEEFGHGRIDARRPVADYDFSARQVIEIIKAFALAKLLGIEAPVMLLDEPTAALSGGEVDFLFSLIESIRSRAAIVFVSHRLSEVIGISDRIYILKDGSLIADMPSEGVAEDRLHELMVGRKREEFFYREQAQRTPEEKPLLELAGLSHAGSFSGVDLTVRAGEIVGVAGLVGSGKSSLARAVVGALPDVTGRVRVDGTDLPRLTIKSVAAAGVGYLPPDRRDGVIPVFSVARNMTLARLTRPGEPALLDLSAEARDSAQLVASLGIKTPGVGALLSSLSGGNQQKALIGRWLLRDAKVLVLDNPTNGVDAGAKEEIYAVLRQIVANGVGILLVSDDLPELIGLSHRILVMRAGTIVKELSAPPDAKPVEADVVAHMV
ncbi:MAG: sugar ABC transporter ATP-binding protein [Rhizobiales bacterium]|nr:sugar ABC transporter ATP-binding protein [Hyphomicrobiales bacterium]